MSPFDGNDEESPLGRGNEWLEPIISRAQSGDAAACAKLYEHYYPQICKYLIRMVGSTEDGHDLAGETFFKMLKYIRTVRATNEQQFRAWLYRIATNTAHDFRRRSHPTYGLPHQPIHLVAFDGGGVEERDHVNRALACLSDLERTCLLLQVVGGFKLHEIAELVAESPHERVTPARISQIIKGARERFAKEYKRLSLEH